MDFELNAEERALADSVKHFVDTRVEPRMREIEERNHIPDELFREAAELGLFGISIPEEFGGSGLSRMSRVLVHEMLGRSGFGFAGALAAHTGIGSDALVTIGTDDQKRRYLPRMATGELRAAFAITEPGAGSDVAAIQTTARKDGGDYVINGSKMYITNGTQADFLTLLARTSDDPGYHSFSLLAVPTNLAGFTVSRKLDKLGIRISDTAELFFDNVRVPAANLIGRENEGFIYQMMQFQHERFSLLPFACTAARDIIDMTLDHVRQRVVFGKPLIKKQVLRHRFADWLTEIECLQQLIYHIVQMKEAGQDATREISMGKLMASQVLMKVADGCLQMYGGLGFMNEMLISRYYRDARGLSIGGGADEVMRDVIAKLQGY